MEVVLRNLGGRAFEEFDGLSEIGVGTQPLAADFDDDGDADLAFSGAGHLFVRANEGDGTFTAPIQLRQRTNGWGPALAEELDGDSLPDLVASAGLPQRTELQVLMSTTRPPFSADCDRDRDGVPDECAPSGGQILGDANQDLRLGLADAMWLLWHLFVDSSSLLPCGSASLSQPKTGDLEILDWSGDGRIDLVDPLSILRWLFLGEAPARPRAPDCVAVPGCPDACLPPVPVR